MKKLLCAISLFVILLSNTPDTNFTLLDFFDGEYMAYSNLPLSNNCINLGNCYMNVGRVQGRLIGESIVIEDLEVASAIKELKAKIIKTEILEDGSNVIYCYTDMINTSVKVDGKSVNIQIAHNEQYSVIGWPLILGSF